MKCSFVYVSVSFFWETRPLASAWCIITLTLGPYHTFKYFALVPLMDDANLFSYISKLRGKEKKKSKERRSATMSQIRQLFTTLLFPSFYFVREKPPSKEDSYNLFACLNLPWLKLLDTLAWFNNKEEYWVTFPPQCIRKLTLISSLAIMNDVSFTWFIM